MFGSGNRPLTVRAKRRRVSILESVLARVWASAHRILDFPRSNPVESRKDAASRQNVGNSWCCLRCTRSNSTVSSMRVHHCATCISVVNTSVISIPQSRRIVPIGWVHTLNSTPFRLVRDAALRAMAKSVLRCCCALRLCGNSNP